MYKTLILALGMFFYVGFSGVAEASPSTNQPEVRQVQQTQVKKIVKKKKKVKKSRAAKVAPENNPFLKNDSIFASRDPYTTNSGDMTASQYWAEEAKRQEVINQQLALKPKTKDERRKEIAQKCGWFTCEPKSKEVVAEAKKWEGKHERRNKKELKTLFSDTGQDPIDPARIPWCAAFANAILNRSGYETTNSLQARSFLHWGRKTNNPQEGDVVVFSRGRNSWAGHVAFFVGYEYFEGVKYVKVLGGNQNQEVNIAYFPVDRVLGYRTAA